MNDMERKLKEYFEQIEPDPSFRETLLALENNVRPSRRRYLLPIAAVLVIALAIGGGWYYLRTSIPQKLPDAAAMSAESVGPKAAAPVAEPDAAPENPPVLPTPPAPAPAPDKPEPDEPEPDVPATDSKTPSASAAPDSSPSPVPMGGKPDPTQNSKPVLPPEEDPPVVDPNPPEEDPPVVDPEPPKEDPPVVDPDPPEENPDPPDVMITLSADFFSDGEQDFVSVTNDETGETVTYDMTGLVPAQAPGTAPSPHQSQEESYSFQRSAFGWDLALTITRDADGSAEASATPIP